MGQSFTNLCCIYKIWFDGAESNPDGNTKLYIGLTANYKTRRAGHLLCFRNNRHRNSYLQNLFNKYGESAYHIEIIEVCEKEKLPEREIFWINFYKTTEREYGYNLRDGGYICNPLPETREKLRQANLGKKHSPETKEKIRLIRSGTNLSEETRAKISESNKGYVHTEDVKEKIAERMKGNTHTKGNPMHENTKAALLKSLQGNQHGKGKVKSPETLEKLSKAHKGKSKPPWSEERRENFKKSKFKHSEETLRKIAEASRKRWAEKPNVYTEEQRQAAREKQLGKKASPETKQKRSESLKKVVHTEEWNSKVSAALKNKNKQKAIPDSLDNN